MGTDIHAFVEVDFSEGLQPFAPGDIRGCGEFFVWRHPGLFEALGWAPADDDGRHTKSRTRGLPSGTSDVVYSRYYHVVDQPGYEYGHLDSVSSFIAALPPVSESQAAEWVAQGLSTYDLSQRNALGTPGRPRVSNPDWHSPGWLSLTEFDELLDRVFGGAPPAEVVVDVGSGGPVPG